MPSFSTKSMTQVVSCEQDIQTIMMEAIKYYDFSAISGGRTDAHQNDLWSKGRKLKDGGDPRKRADWKVVDQQAVVTTKDGYEKKSRHQGQPKSGAIDIVPYPSMWSDESKFFELAGVIKSTQERLLQEGKIKHTLEWGYDLWGWDMPHWQIKKAA